MCQLHEFGIGILKKTGCTDLPICMLNVFGLHLKKEQAVSLTQAFVVNSCIEWRLEFVIFVLFLGRPR